MSRRWTTRRAWRSLVTLSALALFLSSVSAVFPLTGGLHAANDVPNRHVLEVSPTPDQTTESTETQTTEARATEESAEDQATEETAITAQPSELLARDVRTGPGRDMGLVTPLRIAYDAAAEVFIVAGETSTGRAVVRVPRSWNPTEVSPGRSSDLPESPAELTAVNPQDGLTYELSPDGTRLEAYDGSTLVAFYDASSADLTAPTSMTFAPSTDVTDSTENQNLFVANEDGVTEVTLTQEATPTATTDTATLIQSIDTSVWNPPSTDPSGIVWNSRVDELIVVDSEVNETSLYESVNLWKIDRSGNVLSTGDTTHYSDEPTGVGLDTASDTLFITDDTGTRALYVVTAGSDGVLGTSDDASSAVDLTGFSDPEDPEYHVKEGVVYLLSGVDLEVVRVDPNDGIFGNGNDTITSFDISHLGPTDFEGLTHAPNRGTLYVGARNGNHIFEITTTGTLLRTIDVNASGLGKISGLALAPSSTDPSVPSLWNVDRGSDEVNDGKVFELAVPDLDDPGTGNNPPTASFTYTCTGLTCGFADTSTDSDGTVVAFSWDFGDTSGTSTVQNPTYTYASGGTYTVSLTVTDDSSGTDTTSQDVTVSASALPEVNVTASDATAAEPSDNGELTFTRTGDTSGSLTVSYTVGGTATNGTDYDSLSGTVVIPDAQASVAVPVTVIDDALAEDSETVTATVVAGSGYAVGSPTSATVTIADDGDAPVGSTTFEVRVAESTDDAEENSSGSVDLTSSDLELVETRNAQTVGMRFVGVQVPQGATVTNAWIQFQVDETSSVSTDLVLRAQAADSAVTFSTNSGDVTSRPMTSASASWSPVAWNTVGEAGPDQMTPDLSALIQEVVNRPGWSSGNALAIIVTGTGSRVAESFNGASAGAPLLHVEYGSGSVTPVVSVSATDADAGEPSNDGEFTFTRTGDTTNSLTVDYTVGGTATGGSDYGTLSGSVSIPSGQTSVAVPVVVSDDAEVEGVETVVVTVTDGVDYDVGSSSDTVTIADDDVPSVSVSANDSVAGEPADDGEFTFSRTDTAGSLTVHYTVSGTATAGSDYVALSGSVSIPDGQPSATVLVDVLDDSDPESTEIVVVTISASAAYTVGSPSSAQVDISDNDPPAVPLVSVTASDPAAGEPANDGQFTFTRDGSTTGVLTVSYAVTGSATNGTDYVTLTGSVDIPDGQASVTLLVDVNDDTDIEGSETVTVTLLEDAAYDVGSSSDTVTIADDDVPSVSVSANDSVAGEPADDGEFTFSRTDTAGSLTVHYTVSGTATAGSDYVALSGSVSIPDGQPSATVLVDVLDDSDPESTEIVVVTISASAAYTVGSPSSDTITITDDGDLPEVSLTATDSSAAEPSDNGAFTFTRSGPTTDSLTVNYAVTGTATNGSDYTALSGSITIPSGQASATETVVVVDDSEIEGAETVVVTIDPDLAYTIGTPGSDTVTIEDDDGSNLVEVRVANGDDDAEEDPRGKVNLHSPDLKLVERNGRLSTQVVGIRFAGVALPQGATITKAWVQFTTDETNSVRTDLTIRAQAADNPNTFSNVDFDVSSRPTTTASVAWSPPAWNTVDQAETGQQTPDLKTVIQEIVDRPGWQSGYAIAVIVTGAGTRTAESYNGDREAAPLLHIEYTMP